MPRTKDTQLRSIYEKFNKFRDTSNVLSEQMSPRDKQAFDDILQRITITVGVMRSFLNKPKRRM